MSKNDEIRNLINEYLKKNKIISFPEEHLAYDGIIGDDDRVELLYLLKETTSTGF